MENQLGTYSPDVCLVVVAVDDWPSMDQVISALRDGDIYSFDCSVVFLFLLVVMDNDMTRIGELFFAK